LPALRTDPEADAARFRQVLGHFCTGVTVITAAGPGGPAGFACQAFAALSLDPPLVLFCPGRSSVDGALTWVQCAVQAVHEAGDHYLVTGRVTGLGPCRPGRPLLFYRGRYAADPGAGNKAERLPSACLVSLVGPRRDRQRRAWRSARTARRRAGRTSPPPLRQADR
jgi:3-hydroxy-9,10-secoandrosta-1,3,5(10)-triene-9,17-dione monooxygenase reductase component